MGPEIAVYFQNNPPTDFSRHPHETRVREEIQDSIGSLQNEIAKLGFLKFYIDISMM